MPRAMWCPGCQTSHLIRDELVGSRVQCDCGRIQTVLITMPSRPMPASWLSSGGVHLGAIGLLLTSVLAFGGTVAWVVGLDPAPSSSERDPAPPPPKKDSNQKDKEKPPPVPIPSTEPPLPPPSPDLLALLKQLEDPKLEVNRRAVEALPQLEPTEGQRAIPAVVQAVHRHNDVELSKLAADELKRIGPPIKAQVECLQTALRSPHLPMRLYVVSALEQMGDKAAGALGLVGEALKDSSTEVRRPTASILTKLGPQAQVQVLRYLLKQANEDNEKPTRSALDALFAIGPLAPEGVDGLIEAFGDSKRATWVRGHAAVRLGELGERAVKATPTLVQGLPGEKDPNVLVLSIRALGQIGNKKQEVLKPLLTLATTHTEERVRLESLQALEKLDLSVLSNSQIVGQWVKEQGAIRPTLARQLKARLGALPAEQMTELAPLLRHKEPEIVQLGLKVAQERGPAASVLARDIASLVVHEDAEVRRSALAALKAFGAAARKALPTLLVMLLDRWGVEQDPMARKALVELLGVQYATLTAEQWMDLAPVLRHKDVEILRMGLQVVQDRGDVASALTRDIVKLVPHQDATVRQAALAALKALGPAAKKEQPNLVPLLLERWSGEKDSMTRKALVEVLKIQYAALTAEQMTGLTPLLRHRDAEIVRLGLQVAQERGEAASVLAGDIAGLVRHEDEGVRRLALAALQALGPAANKALPALLPILRQTPRPQCAGLALGLADIFTADRNAMETLVPFLLDGLHPESLQAGGQETRARIHQLLVKIGQPAVAGIFKLLDMPSRGKDNINHRKNLYFALIALGPSCKSPFNYEKVKGYRSMEKYPDLIETATGALKMMDPN